MFKLLNRHIKKACHIKKASQVIAIASALLLSSATSQADCVSHVHDQQPHIPNGHTATKSEMHAAQRQLTAYVKQVQQDINCVGDEYGHDASLKRLKKLTGQYNEALAIFNAKHAIAKR